MACGTLPEFTVFGTDNTDFISSLRVYDFRIVIFVLMDSFYFFDILFCCRGIRTSTFGANGSLEVIASILPKLTMFWAYYTDFLVSSCLLSLGIIILIAMYLFRFVNIHLSCNPFLLWNPFLTRPKTQHINGT